MTLSQQLFRHCEILRHVSPLHVTHVMHALLSVTPIHYKCQYIFYKNIHEELLSSKIAETRDTRWPATVY